VTNCTTCIRGRYGAKEAAASLVRFHSRSLLFFFLHFFLLVCVNLN
jgi:hypothetical protein